VTHSPQACQQAIEAYQRGEPRKDIGHRLGMSPYSINAIVRRAGVPTRPQGRPRKDFVRGAAVDAYRAGAPVIGICVRYGICVRTLYRWLDKSNVVKRLSGATQNRRGTNVVSADSVT